jgi:hypothetical protein
MDAPQATFDLFRPFDGDVPGEAAERASNPPPRGISWVLVRATAGAVLALSFVTLAEFAYCLAAELSLARAAKAAALEATLPRASLETICAAAKRRLAANVALASSANISLLQNGVPVGQRFQPQPGDRIAVTISAPKRAVQPYWLQVLCFSSLDQLMTMQAERDMADKEFPASVARRLTSAP